MIWAALPGEGGGTIFAQWHVLQDLVEQDVQELELPTMRFDPPPMPKEETSFSTSGL